VDELHDPDNPPADLSPYRFPASYPQVIGVSATGYRSGGKKSDRGDYFADYSNYGPVVDLTAPAVSVETTVLDGYGSFGGTSAACPHVAGTAALVLAQFSPQSPGWVRSRLMDTAEWIDAFTSEQQGAGMVDAEAAVFDSSSAPPRYTFSPRGKLSVTWGDLKSR
jgi:subtilisin family serine protease